MYCLEKSSVVGIFVINGFRQSNPNNMQNKLFYETPETELILVCFEENIMSVKTYEGFGEEENWDEEE